MNQFTFYWQLIANVVILIIAAIIGLVAETTDPKRSQYNALIIGGIVTVIFIFEFWFFGINENYLTAIVPFIFLVIILKFIADGGNSVPRGSASVLLHKSNEAAVRVLQPGSGVKNWGNHLTTHISADPDGPDRSAADIQKIPIRLEKSPDFRTKVSKDIGLWRAHVNEVFFYFEPISGMLEEALNIAGGARTIVAETLIKLDELLEHFISEKQPEDFDERRGDTKDELEEYLVDGIEKFLEHRKYPFRISNDEIEVGSTELEAAYYEAKLAQSKNRIVQQTADETATALKNRIEAFTTGDLTKEDFWLGSDKVKKSVNENINHNKTELVLSNDSAEAVAKVVVPIIKALK